jgi:hypothetical protein
MEELIFLVSCQVVGITGFILKKLDGTARGGCVVCTISRPFLQLQLAVLDLKIKSCKMD